MTSLWGGGQRPNPPSLHRKKIHTVDQVSVSNRVGTVGTKKISRFFFLVMLYEAFFRNDNY